MTVGSLFAGIGGFDLGFERAGFEIRWQVEIDPFCRAVLAKHWPDVRRYEDVRTVGNRAWAERQMNDMAESGCGDAPSCPLTFYGLEPVDVLCGGFPCQDVSYAGPRIGIGGERSGLWGQFYRIIRELRPRFVVVENTEGLIARGLDRVLGDLATVRYDAEWSCLQASDFGAPHERERVFLVAYPYAIDGQTGVGMRDPEEGPIFAGDYPERLALWLASAGLAPRVDDGIPTPLDRRLRTEAIGNSIVPQIAEWIARRILEAESVAA